MNFSSPVPSTAKRSQSNPLKEMDRERVRQGKGSDGVYAWRDRMGVHWV